MIVTMTDALDLRYPVFTLICPMVPRSQGLILAHGINHLSRLTERQFFKMMDMLIKDFLSAKKVFRMTATFRVALLWVDDSITCVETESFRKHQIFLNFYLNF